MVFIFAMLQFFCSSSCSCSYIRSVLNFQPNTSIKWKSSQGSSCLVLSLCRFWLFSFNSQHTLNEKQSLKIHKTFILHSILYFMIVLLLAQLQAIFHANLSVFMPVNIITRYMIFIDNMVQLFTISIILFFCPFG